MADTGWLDVLARLGPVATAAAAVVALAVGLATVRQRDRADARDQWWRRAQWALDLTLADDVQVVRRGYAVLSHLTGSDLATRDERRLLGSLWELGLIRTPGRPEDDSRPSGGLDDAREVSRGPVRAGDPGEAAAPRGDPAATHGAAGDRAAPGRPGPPGGSPDSAVDPRPG
jgi:hypothetical protein